MKYALALGLLVGAAAPTMAAPITTYPDSLNAGWNVGSGQSNNNFVVTRDGSFELGLRAQERTLGANYVPVGAGGYANAMYNVPTGQSANPPSPTSDYGRWNFDFSIASANSFTASIHIERLTPGLTPLSDVLLNFSSATGSPVQDSFNPGFDFLSGLGGYDYNATGIYRFTLTATSNGETITDSMLVNIGGTPLSAIPEPATIATFALMGGCAVLGVRRRKQIA